MIKLACRLMLVVMPLVAFAESSNEHPMRKMNGGGKPKDENVVTFGLESNIYSASSFLSPSVDFSLKDGWDVQLATYNVPTSDNFESQFTWDTYLNVSKTYEVTDNFRAILGTQNGVNLGSTHKNIHQTHFGLLSWKLPIEHKIILQAGTYWANKAATLTTDVVGFMAGAYIDIIPDHVQFAASYMNGENNVAGANVNLVFKRIPYLPQSLQPYIGVGIPEFKSGNEFYGTVGINWSTPGFQ